MQKIEVSTAPPPAIHKPFPDWLTKKFTLAHLYMLLFVLVIGFLTAYPVWSIFLNSFRVNMPGQPIAYGIDSWVRVFSEPAIMDTIGNSFLLAAGIVFTATPLAVAFCWLLTRTDMPFKKTIEFLLWMGFFLPMSSIALGWILLADPDYGVLNKLFLSFPFFEKAPFNIYSYWGLIWVHLGFSTSIRFILLTPAFRAMDGALEESAWMSGYSKVSTIFRITMPILLPAILAAVFLGFIKALESYEIELLIGVPAKYFVYSTEVRQLISDPNKPDFGGASALSTLFLAVIFLLIFLYHKTLKGRSFTTVTGKAQSTTPVRLGKFKPVAVALVAIYILVMLVLPVGVTLVGSVMKVFGFFTIKDPYTLAQWNTVLSDTQFFSVFFNTMIVGLGSAFFGVVMFFIISYIVLRTTLSGRSLLDFFSWLPWALPGILLGLGFLWMLLGNELTKVIYGTLFALILVLVVKEFPLGVQMTKSGLMQLSPDLEHAALLSGAPRLYAIRKILLPLMFPALVSIGLITFISSIRDVAIVQMVSTHSSKTLSLMLVEYAIGGSQGAAAVIGTLLIFIVVLAAGISYAVTKNINRL
jgi:iron(III) transport system permease protein